MLTPRLEAFVRERQYLTNVSPGTLEWYRRCLKWLPSESPTQADLKDLVVKMREKGLKETGANAILRCLNAYLHWASGSERRCGAGCTHPHVRQLREPELVLPVFSDAEVKRLVSWRPKGKYQRRLHLLVLLLLDTGCRISEALSLRVSDLNLADLLVTLNGKGRKQRIVPFSAELRKVLFRYVAGCREDALLFACRTGTLWSRRNALRNVKTLCTDLGFKPPARTLHAFRHTFAVNYLRRGGSVFHLQKVLGHSSLEMTRRYANLVTADLQAIHERVSLLSKP
ncbi:tyrosine-type recombinase/integrase [Edaphobacter aggregans]|uniref:tyrosine-type recombinase/integrase n=1 Tax=Edaphobacter aggregans TaxID=570835 RepID=UPI000AF97CF3|nr:site-specific integrase [Edaphobacter aggregans]